MHRSGTSALARSTGLMTGYDTPEAVRTFDDWGHRENTSLRAVNDRLLRDAGGDWSAPPDDLLARLPVDRAREPGSPYAAALAALGDGAWVWKDPRTCLTLPLWQAADRTPPVLVVSVRNPVEVARS